MVFYRMPLQMAEEVHDYEFFIRECGLKSQAYRLDVTGRISRDYELAFHRLMILISPSKLLFLLLIHINVKFLMKL